MSANPLAESPEVELLGADRPRIRTRRPHGNSRGPRLVRWSRDTLGVELLPWQSWVLSAGLVRRGRRWASRTVVTEAARQNGKSSIGISRALGGMKLWGEQVLSMAQNRDVGMEVWTEGLELATAAGLEVWGVNKRTNREQFRVGNGRWKVVSRTGGGARSLKADLVLVDELREYRSFDAWAAVEKTRRARDSQLWVFSNEGDESSVVLNWLAAQGRTAARLGSETDLAWFEWSAPPDVDRSDPRGWVAANPGLGRLITADTIRSELLRDPPEIFETEVLCRRVVTLRPWLGEGMWMGCADPRASVPDGAEVVFALDAGPEMRHASVAAGWVRPDGRVHVEVVAAFDELANAANELAELVGRWRCRGVVVAAKSPAEAAARRVLRDLEVPVKGLHGGDLMRAQNAMTEAVAARSVVHPGDGLTAGHVAAVTSEGTLTRRSAQADIDAAVAVVLALHGAGTLEAVGTQDWMAY